MNKFAAFCMLALVAASVNSAGAEITGKLMNAQPMYTLQDRPVDPSLSTIEFTGKWNRNGRVVLHIYNPDTNCVTYNGSLICGNRAADVTYTFVAVHTSGSRSYFQLESVVNNPGPQNTGIVYDVKVAGYWRKDGEVEIYLSNTLEASNKGVSAYAVVSMKTIYSGSVDKHNVFNGHVMVRANPYLVVGGVPRPTLYQMVSAPYTPFSSAIINQAVPRRAKSPYSETNPAKITAPVTISFSNTSLSCNSAGSCTAVGPIISAISINPSTPVADLQISGDLSNVVFGAGNFFTAEARIFTANYGATFNQTGVMKGSFYRVPDHKNLYHIYAADFVDSLGKIHILDNADVVLSY